MIRNSYIGYKRAIETLNNIYKTRYFRKDVFKYNHALLVPENKDCPVFYAVFKKERPINFGYWFSGHGTKGASINEGALALAMKHNAYRIIIIRGNISEFLVISPKFWYDFAKDYGLIRVQEKLNSYLDKNTDKIKEKNERTWHMPDSMFNDIEELRKEKVKKL